MLVGVHVVGAANKLSRIWMVMNTDVPPPMNGLEAVTFAGWIVPGDVALRVVVE
jgi:hypothetical protein